VMSVDAEGYGSRSDDDATERLLQDARVLSPAGIERAAWGWDRHEDPAVMQRFREAERAALHVLEQADRTPEWDRVRKQILDLTEGRTSLVSWKVEHGDIGHKAERALFAAALGLLARAKLDHQHYVILVRPISEALPWLLPEASPEPRR
jgi:hypothetical protein